MQEIRELSDFEKTILMIDKIQEVCFLMKEVNNLMPDDQKICVRVGLVINSIEKLTIELKRFAEDKKSSIYGLNRNSN
jgi:hypothetical protein